MARPATRVGVVLRATAVALAFAVAGATLFAFAGDLAGVLTRRRVDTAKALIAGAAALLLLLDLLLGRGRERRAGPRDGALALLAAVAGLAWWNFMQFHYDHYLHYSDTYHYYIGSKYFAELGYTRLYACTLVADAEGDPQAVASERTVRDLATNRMTTAGEVLADPAACRHHFTPERWAEFTRDVGWFRSKVPSARWQAMHRDHGYNPPPTWGALGGWLASLAPASDRQILALGLLDPLLLAGMWAAVAWAFGWRALAVAVVYWGTNYFGIFGWNGGGFLRQSWLVAAVAGICCLRRGRPLGAGILLTLATALRVFPGAILVGVGLRAGWSLVGEGAVSAAQRRLALGCLVAAGAVAAATLVGGGGPAAWTGFVANSRLHLATPLKNHVGLRTVLAHDASAVDRRITTGTADERYRAWRDARTRQFARRAPAYWGSLAAFVWLLALAVRRQPDWVSAVLGVGLIPVAFELTNYYYSVLLVYGFLSVRWRSIGAALCGLAAATWIVADRWQWQDEVLTWCSVLVVLFVLFATEQVRRAGAESRAEPAA